MHRIFAMLLVALVYSTANAQCVDARGVPVAEVANYQLPDIAQATVFPNGVPVIFFNPNVLSSVSPPTRLFFQVHECAHHVLGHTLGRLVMNVEQEADCWAIRTIVSKRMVSPVQFQMIQADLFRFGQGDWTHLPGPQRAINLQACLR